MPRMLQHASAIMSLAIFKPRDLRACLAAAVNRWWDGTRSYDCDQAMAGPGFAPHQEEMVLPTLFTTQRVIEKRSRTGQTRKIVVNFTSIASNRMRARDLTEAGLGFSIFWLPGQLLPVVAYKYTQEHNYVWIALQYGCRGWWHCRCSTGL